MRELDRQQRQEQVDPCDRREGVGDFSAPLRIREGHAYQPDGGCGQPETVRVEVVPELGVPRRIERGLSPHEDQVTGLRVLALESEHVRQGVARGPPEREVDGAEGRHRHRGGGPQRRDHAPPAGGQQVHADRERDRHPRQLRPRRQAHRRAQADHIGPSGAIEPTGAAVQPPAEPQRDRHEHGGDRLQVGEALEPVAGGRHLVGANGPGKRDPQRGGRDARGGSEHP